MSRPASRRRVLAGLAAAPAAMPAPAVAGQSSADVAAVVLFERWWTAYHAACERGLSDEEGDHRDGILAEIEHEHEIAHAPASVIKAATLAVMAARFPFAGLAESPAERLRDPGLDHLAVFTWSVLEVLRPFLTGHLAVIVGDFLDHPDRPVGQSRLIGAGRWRDA